MYPRRKTDSDSARFPAVTLSERENNPGALPSLSWADELGITELPDPEIICDVAVVGGGSRRTRGRSLCGLRRTLHDSHRRDGPQEDRAGASSKIENYLGFPPPASAANSLATRATSAGIEISAYTLRFREKFITIEQVGGMQ